MDCTSLESASWWRDAVKCRKYEEYQLFLIKVVFFGWNIWQIEVKAVDLIHFSHEWIYIHSCKEPDGGNIKVSYSTGLSVACDSLQLFDPPRFYSTVIKLSWTYSPAIINYSMNNSPTARRNTRHNSSKIKKSNHFVLGVWIS